MSDSGHFDDVLSLNSAQSAYSPGPRHVLSSPETERLAEVYQHKIDDVTRKQGEKSLEDRKSLVKMYEKKMEDMSRKYSEKFQQEKNDIIEMYEKKIGDIVRRHKEKGHEDKITNEEREEDSLLTSQQSTIVQNLTEKLEETQQMLETTQKNATSLSQQLEDVNLRYPCFTPYTVLCETILFIEQINTVDIHLIFRYNDLQHELFQSRERTVLLEDEVETLQKAIAMHEQQISEKNVALVQNAQIESELSLLRQLVEEQKVNLELKSQLESELARVLNKLKEAEQKCKVIEDEKTEAETLYHQKQEEMSKLISQLEGEISEALHQLQTKEEKCKEIVNKKTELETLYEQSQEASSQLISELKGELSDVLQKLKTEEQKRREIEAEKTEAEVMYQENQKESYQLASELRGEVSNVLQKLKEEQQKCKELKSQLQTELAKMSACLEEEKEKNMLLEKDRAETITLYEEEHKKVVQLQSDSESARCEMLTLKEEEQKHTIELAAALERDLAATKIRLEEEESKNKELACWKQEAENMKEEMANHIQHEKLLTEQLGSLENEVDDLKSSLLEKGSSRNELHSTIQKLEERLDSSQKEANGQLQKVSELRDRLTNVEGEAIALTKLLSVEKQKNEELLHWKTQADTFQLEIKSLKEDIEGKNLKLQYFSGIEGKVIEIQECLSVEKGKVQDFIQWKIKAKDLEEEIKSLKDDISLLNQNTHLSENNNTECLQNVPLQAQQEILLLEAEVEKLKESLDQSYWIQSEKETTRHEMEKTMLELTTNLKKMEEDNLILNETVSSLKYENDILRALKNKNPSLASKIDVSTLLLSESSHMEGEPNTAEALPNNFKDQCTVDLHQLPENGNSDDSVPQLKTEIESLKRALADQEERHTEMNLKMYLKGQEAAKFERKDQV